MSSLMRKPVLQLNASYEALRVITARRAIELIVRNKAIGLDDVPMIKIAPGLMVSNVIKLLHYRRVPVRMQVVSKRNIVLRDGGRCMYCGEKFHSSELTLDHIIPRSKGGKQEWNNLVAACGPCNRKKGDLTPEEWGVPLIRRPLPSTIHTSRWMLRELGMEEPAWKKYLYA